MKFLSYVFLRLGLYRLKSRLYRFLFERKYRDVPVRPVSTLIEIGRRLGPKWWRADNWRQLWDAVSYPGRVQAYIDEGVPPLSGFDCDEFAIYTAHVLNVSRLRYVYSPRFVTVLWRKGWLVEGHNVCAYSDGEELGFYDYGVWRVGHSDYAALARSVCAEFAPGAEPMAFAVHDLELRPLVVERL